MKPTLRKGLKIFVLLLLLFVFMALTIHFYLFSLTKLKHHQQINSHKGLIATVYNLNV